jgi:hypothetical protein
VCLAICRVMALCRHDFAVCDPCAKVCLVSLLWGHHRENTEREGPRDRNWDPPNLWLSFSLKQEGGGGQAPLRLAKCLFRPHFPRGDNILPVCQADQRRGGLDCVSAK